MQKIHGEYSVEPLTIVDISVSDYAAIQEHKLLLDHSTNDLNNDINAVNDDLQAHKNTYIDPHGGALYQTELYTNHIRTPASAFLSTITVQNPGAGLVYVNILGDLHANTLSSTDVTSTNMATFQNVTINGTLLVEGQTIESNATVVDYDVLKVTPTTLTNPHAISVIPDNEGNTGGIHTYYGHIFYSQKLVNGVLSDAFIVDSVGNISTTATNLSVSTCTWTNDGTKVDASIIQRAPQYISYVNEGFKYVPTSDALPTDKSFVAKKADGTSNVFYVTKGGSLWIENCLSIGGSSSICWDAGNSSLTTSENFRFVNADQYFVDSPIHIQGVGKTEWIVKNNNSSTAFYYDSQATPLVEFTSTDAYLNQTNTRVKNLVLNGNLTLGPGQLIDGVDVGSHDHSGGTMGVRIPATSVYIGSPINSTSIQADHIDVHHILVQDTVVGMISSNIENGITVTSSGVSGSKKLNFQVHPFTINLSNDCDGSVVVTNPAAGGTTFTIPVNVHDDSHDHTNLDGTTSYTWQLAAGTGPKIKTDGTNFSLRNSGDTAYVDLIVNNLTVQGTQTTINSETMTVADNVVLLNSNVTGTPTEDAGIEVERGTSTNAQWIWVESTDRWYGGVTGSLSPVVREADLNNGTNTETIQDIVGDMVTGVNSDQLGIAVTYDDVNGKLDFNVSDFTINFTGNDASGAVTITNLATNSVALDILRAAALDCTIGAPYGPSMELCQQDRNDVAYKIVHTDSTGKIKVGTIDTTSVDNGTTTITRVYASSNGEIRYYTPSNFATQILALGGAVKNSHTHLSADVTDATSTWSVGKLVKYGTNGDFTAGTITAALSGNASSATVLQTARTINAVSFNGSANIVVDPYVEGDEASNASRPVVYVDDQTPGYKRLNMDSAFTFNPATNTLTTSVFAGALSGNAATASKWLTPRTITLSGPVTGSQTIDGSGNVTINTFVTAGGHSHVSADISDASSTGTVGRLVLYGAGGNFSAGTITAALNGNAATATKLSSTRTFSLSGDVTGSVVSDLTSGFSMINTQVSNDSHTHDTRYFTETESDDRYVNETGDTMTGTLKMDTNAHIWIPLGSSGAIQSYNTTTQAITGALIQNNAVDGWALRSRNSESTVSVYLQRGDTGANVGRLYADSTYNVGFLHPTSGLWRLLIDSSGSGTFTGQCTATQFNGPLNGNANTATALTSNITINTVAANGGSNIVVDPRIDSDSTNADRYIVFVQDPLNGQHQRLYKDVAGLKFNPSTNTVTATNFNGTATAAYYSA